MAKSGVVLLSGGLDSATVLAIARSDGFACHTLTVAYGQRHAVELQAAERVAKTLGAASHRVVNVDLNQIGGSALTDDIDVPKDGSDKGIPVTYVPARNSIFLSIALGLAEVVGAQTIFAGMNAVDYSGYPDCRPEFVFAFESMANLATKAGIEGAKFEVRAPLMTLTKPDIIREGIRLGVDFGQTHSCYDPIGFLACGKCDSCRIRLRAFAEVGVEDPAAYAA